VTRSRLRKLRRLEAKTARAVLWKAAPVASALLSCIPTARADDQPESGGLMEVVVTAQKRAENLQDVPLSIQAIGNTQLSQLNVSNFDDYTKLLPNVSFQTTGPSYEHTYMRGVTSGGDGNHSGSQPSVGMYFDEQPVTTIDGNLNIHIYDIERVESLAGPQGTLYGASSESGTIRIITNKPDPSGFKAGYDIEGNTVDHGSEGYKFEGFVNLPISATAAVRLVGWDERDAGYIDNVHGTAYFPTSNTTLDNANLVRNNYNGVETKGGRAAIKFDVNDNWTILPQVMGQVSDTDGNFAFNPKVGDLETLKFFPETAHDSWVQSALTIEGKLSDFDLVYSGSYLTRNVHEQEDYTDYSLFYDASVGAYFVDNAGNLINPAQDIRNTDHYSKTSNELRISSPKDWPFRFTAGLFLERQVHEILQNYVVDNFNDPLGSVAPNDVSVPGWPGTLWLTDQERVDRDSAEFAQVSYDFTTWLSGDAGIRHYHYDNTLQGFYGFSSTYDPGEGVGTCATPFVPFHGAPCQDLNQETSGSGNSPRLNLTYKLDKDRLLYATWSKGFRPGGVNRNGGGTIPPYKPDYLTNYEIGWKTTWLDNRLRFNGALFWENWKNFQFSYLGPNALTIITNAGNARIKGLETDLQYLVVDGLTLSGGFSLLDAKLTQDFCGDPTQCGITPGYEQFAPAGTRLPVTPKFKGDVTARYTYPFTNTLNGNVQGSLVYVGARTVDLRAPAQAIFGPMPSYTVADFSAGVEWNNTTADLFVSNAFDRRAILDKFSECDVEKCGAVNIYEVPNQPRTIGLRFGQKF
jgi:iron complex outermembrane receptor protein